MIFTHALEGCVAESTIENIEMAKSGDLYVSFPFLQNYAPVDLQSRQSNCHPAAGSNVRLSLFDIFHYGNKGNDVEALCRIDCGKELRSIVSNQAAEQLHRSSNEDKYLLNQTTPFIVVSLCSVLL